MEEEVESIPEALCYKQRLEKSTGAEMFLMTWSPVADLLAAACTDHSVVLNRLSWQRVWSIPPAESAVSALTWRPDGRVLAVGRQDGLVCLHSVEDGHLLHEFSAGAAITQLQWTQQSEDSYKTAEYTRYEEQWKKYLPPLPALDSSQESFTSKSDGVGKHYSSDPKQLFSHLKTVNLLLIGDEVGRVHFCVSGVLLAASAEINSTQDSGHVIVTSTSDDFRLITCAMIIPQSHPEEQSKLCLQNLKTSLITDRSHELQHLALKFGHISSLLEYMSSTLKSMHEAWEDLLLMMDSKLASYASTLPEGKAVSDEFLILLACGRARNELQTFLVDELTAKGVKKLGLSLEMSYTSIRKYVINHLNGAIQSLHYHLTEVLGMARWTDRFGALGLSEAAIQESMNHVGTFALKSRELLLAIDDSLKSIKVFFVWLYGVILKLSGDPLPNGMKDHVTGEELKLITDFLRKRLSKASEEDAQTFNLEVVGQYLEDQDLKYVEERPPSLLEAIIEDAKLDLKNIPWMFLPDKKKSLVQLFHTVHSNIDTVFATPMASIQQSFVNSITTELGPVSCDSMPTSHLTQWLKPFTGHFVHRGSHYIYHPTPTLSSRSLSLFQASLTNSAAKDVATTAGCESITLARYQDSEKPMLKFSRFHVCNVPAIQDKDMDQRCQILSLQYYNEDALSILLHYLPKRDEEDLSSSLAPGSAPLPHQAVAQLPIEGVVSLLPWDTVESHDPAESVDVGHILTQVCPLGPFRAGKLAVSGTRKLAAVLTSNGKKIRLFDVDFEGEEED